MPELNNFTVGVPVDFLEIFAVCAFRGPKFFQVPAESAESPTALNFPQIFEVTEFEASREQSDREGIDVSVNEPVGVNVVNRSG